MPKYEFKDRQAPQGLVPKDRYEFTLVEVEDKLAKTSGNQMFEITLRLDGKGRGVRVKDHLVFTEKAMWKIDTFLKATGQAPEEKGETSVEADMLYGLRGEADIDIEEREWNGRPFKKNIVAGYPADGRALDRDPAISRVPF